jgi:hypothetical protein
LSKTGNQRAYLTDLKEIFGLFGHWGVDFHLILQHNQKN